MLGFSFFLWSRMYTTAPYADSKASPNTWISAEMMELAEYPIHRGISNFEKSFNPLMMIFQVYLISGVASSSQPVPIFQSF